MTRPTISAKDQVTVAIYQANMTHNPDSDGIVCPLCRRQLASFEARILEHMIPRAWTNADPLDDLRWVHKLCADRKTYGNKATSADGDLHKIAKVKRLRIARLAKDQVEKKLTKQKWRLKRKVSGETVRVRTR